MELKELLKQSLKERFSANAIIKSIEKEIMDQAEEITLSKYEDEIVIADGLEFELGGVQADLDHRRGSLNLNEVDLILTYFCISKLPKAKREKLKYAKSLYRERNYTPYSNYKVDIWRNIRYSIDIETVLSGNINLKLEL